MQKIFMSSFYNFQGQAFVPFVPKNAQILCRSCNASKGAKNFPKKLPVTKKVTWFVKRVIRR